MKRRTYLTALAALVCSALGAQGVKTPTMGWSSWNTFALNISEDIIKSQADAMISTGLADVGYKYINIDDGYWNGRGRDGKLILNSKTISTGWA